MINIVPGEFMILYNLNHTCTSSLPSSSSLSPEASFGFTCPRMDRASDSSMVGSWSFASRLAITPKYFWREQETYYCNMMLSILVLCRYPYTYDLYLQPVPKQSINTFFIANMIFYVYKMHTQSKWCPNFRESGICHASKIQKVKGYGAGTSLVFIVVFTL